MDCNVYFSEAAPVRLEDVLDAREARVGERRRLLLLWKSTLVCFTLNMPGEYKVFALADKSFELGKRLILGALGAAYGRVHTSELKANAGNTAFFGTDGDAADVKKRLAAVEEAHPLGRLFDIDVYDAGGNAVHRSSLGMEQRRCLICAGPVWRCARSRSHSAQELSYNALKLMAEYFDGALADEIAQRAVRALITEAAVTPKPGLVDRNGSGAHGDMDFFTFIDSACCLLGYFRSVSLMGMRFSGAASEMLAALQPQGIEAERRMLDATGGVNTHKGAIFSVGILCAAAGYMYGRKLPPEPETLFKLAAEIARPCIDDLGSAVAGRTNGQTAFVRHGVTGVRGEAASGFESVRSRSLPEYRRLKSSGAGTDAAGVISLLHLMAHASDTNIISRSSIDGMKQIQRQVGGALKSMKDEPELLRFSEMLDRELTERKISPGGCADLLAVTIFADSLFDGTVEP